ncbi:MAG: RNA 2',3'-cyclic phosphodiesterase [Eubacteriales bacterium]|nr:RNA 2',3'-cyclic phosphodiesterase [Eubacteriales bacterium]
MRLFVAINFTGEVKRQILNVVKKVRENSAQGNFINEKHMHLTVEFLGEISNSELKSINGIMDNLKFEPFTLSLNKIGYFKGHDGNTYWLGIERNNTLFKIQAELHQGLQYQGFNLENREFRPHITIGRQVKLNDSYNIGELSGVPEKIEIYIDKIDLMKSERINGHLVYSVVHSVSASIN